MTDQVLSEVLRLADQLSPEEKQQVINRLQAAVSPSAAEIAHAFQQDFGLLMLDLGTFLAEDTIRREDEYGSDER